MRIFLRRKNITLLLIGAFLFSVLLLSGCDQSAQTVQPEQVLLSSTIGPIDAGIVSVLEDAYEQKTGVRVRHVGAGTSAALKIGKAGLLI